MTDTRPGPPASPQGHPDLDTLADFDAGVLDPAQSARLRSHVSACARCQRIIAGIGGVPLLLRRLPPAHIPPEVEERIFAALDAERLAMFGPTQAPTGGATPVEGHAAGPIRVRPGTGGRAGGRTAAGGSPSQVTSLNAARRRRRV